jgi:heme-degrading monooxygenase HmoA
MFVVIFEVRPRKQRFNEYLAIAKSLRPYIEKIDGFLDNERFASKHRAGVILSLSTWRDEKALIRWRTLAVHHEAQEKGRFEIFEDYRLRVGEIVADTEPPQGLTLRQQRFDETEIGAAKAVTISELPGKDGRPASPELAADLSLAKAGSPGLVDHELFESIYNPGKLLLLASWQDVAAAESSIPAAIARGAARHRRVRVIRDYGMRERREAPQYYPAIEPRST